MSATATTRPGEGFDPLRHQQELGAILDALADDPGLDDRELDRLLRRHPKDGRGLFSRSELLAGLRRLRPDAPGAQATARRLRLRPVRSLSGVTPVTVLTRPFPCPGRCVFCPDDPRMPKSYLSAEPGCQRAASHGFDPYHQTRSRLAALREIGHPVDKIELIVLGGTFSAYPEAYRVAFVRRCLEAMNEFGAPAEHPPDSGEGWPALARVQRANETAAVRCVGMAFETRPDHVDPAELLRLRRLGATKLQIGIQSLDDAILARNRRGHDVATTRRALALARSAGFKIHAHWMPNLLGANPEGDRRDFARLFDDPGIRPDELKLYPCLLVESAELMQHYRRGEWRPYPDEELTRLLADCLERTPPWCRLTRVVRDFSSADIVAGTKRANLREVAEQRLRETGRRCRDIRSRELRAAALRPEGLRLEELRYASAIGEERFLQWVTGDGRLAGFLRLSLPERPSCVPELGRSAVVREVHVYGSSLELGRRGRHAAQHRGLGGALVARAAELARASGFASLAVISAVGTRGWYRRLGFRDGPLYQSLPLEGPGAKAGSGRGAPRPPAGP